MPQITLITTDKYGKKDKEHILNTTTETLAFLTQGNYIDVDGVEYFVHSIKTTLKDGILVDFKAKLTLDGTKF